MASAVPTIDGKGIGEFKEFPVPKHLLGDGILHLTFDRPAENVNWRDPIEAIGTLVAEEVNRYFPDHAHLRRPSPQRHRRCRGPAGR